eukprot:comp24170_c0_seq1/m.44095 comp24170_c0_seq1/g.44095  ORF comp24170_c0_seq1/g.44095 comp24170_c0_seq1/m.44095 type:complete len:342 (-) comp24170_c0_seq1:640-1665(-)
MRLSLCAPCMPCAPLASAPCASSTSSSEMCGPAWSTSLTLRQSATGGSWGPCWAWQLAGTPARPCTMRRWRAHRAVWCRSGWSRRTQWARCRPATATICACSACGTTRSFIPTSAPAWRPRRAMWCATPCWCSRRLPSTSRSTSAWPAAWTPRSARCRTRSWSRPRPRACWPTSRSTAPCPATTSSRATSHRHRAASPSAALQPPQPMVQSRQAARPVRGGQAPPRSSQTGSKRTATGPHPAQTTAHPPKTGHPAGTQTAATSPAGRTVAPPQTNTGESWPHMAMTVPAADLQVGPPGWIRMAAARPMEIRAMGGTGTNRSQQERQSRQRWTTTGMPSGGE